MIQGKWIPPVLLASVLACGVSWAQESDNTLRERIDKWVAPLVDAGHLSGSFLAARGNAVIYERSWNIANRETNAPFTPQTKSCVASVTKPTTVIIAAKLIEDGVVNLTDPVSNWLPDFPKAEQIQFQHLLFHRSGIPHRLTAPDDENVQRTAADMVELAAKREFDFKPGTRYQYSSGGYSVLIRVMELASGKDYQTLLAETILEPLNLSNTVHPSQKSDIKEAATSYRWTVDGQEPGADMDYSFLVGAGSLFSTPRDLLAISRALVDGKFGERARRQLLRGGKLRWNGITNHYRAFLEYDAKTDVTVVLVANQMTGANDLLRQNIPKIIAGETIEPYSVPRPNVVKLPADLLKRYAGQYNIAGSPMPVRAKDGALFANDWILLPTSETAFYSPQDYSTVTVKLEDGVPVELDWAGMKCRRLGKLEDE